MDTAKKKYLVGLIIAASIITFVLTADMVSKALTDGVYDLELIPTFLYFSSHHNPNAAFSFSFGLSSDVFSVVVITFTFIASGAIIFLIVWLKNKHILFTVSLAMIFAGAVGNLIDRLAFGYVRDFVQVKYFGLEIFGSTSFAIFNIADASLICGGIVLIVWVLFFYMRAEMKKEAEKKAAEKEQSAQESDDIPG